MKTLAFEKEQNGNWYVVLPEWTGDKSALQMVAGADVMLDKLCSNKNSVTLLVSEEQPTEIGFEKITKIIDIPFGGATYMSKWFPIWLCDVVKFIYDGKMPKTLYYKVSE